MKYLVVSDIHGNDQMITQLYRIVAFHKPTKIILLGDLGGYFSPNYRILSFIEEYQNDVILVKGNCDSDFDYPQPMHNFYVETINGKEFVFTHGHLMDPFDLPNIDVYVYGHTHVGEITETEDRILFNPGSLSQPRNGSAHSYGIITDEDLELYDIDKGVIKKLSYRK